MATAFLVDPVELKAQNNGTLRITEVLSVQAPSPAVPGDDWWELTNFGTTAMDLSGWRFNDSGGGLTDAFVIPQGVAINPGESIIFVENNSPDEFRFWWGADNLPAGLKVITYSGAGLSFGGSGDTINLWDSKTVDAGATQTTVTFGAADEGVSFNYDPVTGVFGGKSQLGVNGVFKATNAPDIASPGRIRATTTVIAPRLTITRIALNRVQITLETTMGATYSLEESMSLPGGWNPTGDVINATATSGSFEKDVTGDRRFFRVRVE